MSFPMSTTSMILHSDNFDLCRLCMLEPEANRNVKFINVFSAETKDPKLAQHIFKIFDVKINKADFLPKIICQYCYKFVLSWRDMKKKSLEAQIILNYIYKRSFETSRLTINESDSSKHSMNNTPSTTSYLPHTVSEHKTKVSSTHTNFGSSSNISIQSTSSQMFTVHQFTKPTYNTASDSDDDSTSCELLNANEEVISISSENEETEYRCSALHYCSICKLKNNYDHECFHYNNEFSTCLVPSCNILAKSIKDIIPHLRQHMGMPSGAILCHRCFKENKISERDLNGFHTACRYNNVFKCYLCNVIFKTMPEFATHKLKNHKGQLRDSNGQYLCLYCEIASTDMMMIVEHQKYCREFQNNKEKQNASCTSKYNQPLEEITLSDDRNKTKQVFRKHKRPKFLNSSKHLLFTCLKPSCNLIFQNFATFKFHHREHFGIGNELMCWQCCSPFSNLNFLRMHQVKGNCRTPGMFKCYECSQDCGNLQSLSIHKYTEHNGKLIINKKGKKNIMCAFCKIKIDINNLKNHMISCELNNNKKDDSTPQQKNKEKFHECSVCPKKCLTLAALRSHEKIHNSVKKKKNE